MIKNIIYAKIGDGVSLRINKLIITDSIRMDLMCNPVWYEAALIEATKKSTFELIK